MGVVSSRSDIASARLSAKPSGLLRRQIDSDGNILSGYRDRLNCCQVTNAAIHLISQCLDRRADFMRKSRQFWSRKHTVGETSPCTGQGSLGWSKPHYRTK